MLRSRLCNALLVTVFALAAFAALSGSVGAQPAPDDDPDYSDPIWRVANPVDSRAANPPADTELVATDSADASSQTALPANDGDSFDPSDPKWWIASEESTGGR